MRQAWLNSAMPKAVIAGCPAMPSSFSASTSAGSPWQSQPKRRNTTCPRIVR